jgi:hypothetical protein
MDYSMPVSTGRQPRSRLYVCPACGQTKQDELQPECPADGELMEPAQQ